MAVTAYCYCGIKEAERDGFPILQSFKNHNGTMILAEERPEACAKKSINDQGQAFFNVKVCSDGTLFDPAGENPKGAVVFRPIAEGAFEKYLLYLKTGRKHWLIEARRAYI